MAQQTAVEWLQSEWKKKDMDISVHELWQQAKEMEKEQIIETWNHGNLPTFLGRVLTAEQYYNETYNK